MLYGGRGLLRIVTKKFRFAIMTLATKNGFYQTTFPIPYVNQNCNQLVCTLHHKGFHQLLTAVQNLVKIMVDFIYNLRKREF